MKDLIYQYKKKHDLLDFIISKNNSHPNDLRITIQTPIVATVHYSKNPSATFEYPKKNKIVKVAYDWIDEVFLVRTSITTYHKSLEEALDFAMLAFHADNIKTSTLNSIKFITEE